MTLRTGVACLLLVMNWVFLQSAGDERRCQIRLETDMPQKLSSKPVLRPPQRQRRQPGLESRMRPRPTAEAVGASGAGKLHGKVALITGGDSGIGRAVAIAFAKEGADLAIVYRSEHTDARETVRPVERQGQRALRIAGDIGREPSCRKAVRQAVLDLGRLDIVVNNAGEQHPKTRLQDITVAQLERTFRTNIFSFFYGTKAALRYLRRGSAIINTSSVTAYRGSPHLMDYAATKGAIVSFTRSLSQALSDRGIRVNAVAPGPIWTPLIPASFPPRKVATFDSDVPLGRAGERAEVAPCYVLLAWSDGSYITGQVRHPNGEEIVNG
jgi:NAD(P)-dependent dehydrogenase (short-subunit alcohol dehydrogenase family)